MSRMPNFGVWIRVTPINPDSMLERFQPRYALYYAHRTWRKATAIALSPRTGIAVRARGAAPVVGTVVRSVRNMRRVMERAAREHAAEQKRLAMLCPCCFDEVPNE